jgi:ribosome maturation factor RimP
MSNAETGRKKMSKREDYEAECEKLLQPIAEKYQVEIYDIEYVKEGSDYYLRAYIDKPEGVNIIDCENVSRALSDELDRVDFIPDAYILEVSSPGLGRTLKKDKHLEKSIGREVEIKLFKALDKQKEFSGTLESFDTDTVTIITSDSGEERKFNRADVALIRLALDF